MADAKLADYEALVDKVHAGVRPILPQPKWGQNAAYLAFMIDGMRDYQSAQDTLIELQKVTIQRLRESLGVVARDGHVTGCWCQKEAQRSLGATSSATEDGN